MMTTTLVLPNRLSEELSQAARQQLETAAVLVASVVHAPNGDVRVLGRELRMVPPTAYLRRDVHALTISSDGYVPALAEAERLNAVALWVHTHPGLSGIPTASTHDNVVDELLAETFRVRTGSEYYGALIVSPRTENRLAFTGYIQAEAKAAQRIERLWTVGDRFRLERAFDSHTAPLEPIFDRNVRAFGGAVQQTLSDLRVGVVGCGGTGSIVVEQLVRLGVRHFVLADPDTLTESNLTRVYGSFAGDESRRKVDVVSEHIRRIAPDAQCQLLPSMITIESVARELVACDIIFGCTDDNAGRLVLSRLATYFLLPIVDCGVLLTSDAHQRLVGIDARVTLLLPNEACLVCRGRIDTQRAAAELMTPSERVRLEREGYAPELGRQEPAVVSFTTMVGAAAVSELLERLVGYGPLPAPSEILLRCHDREVSTNRATPRAGHYCHPESGKLGIGVTTPFLEQIWPA